MTYDATERKRLLTNEERVLSAMLDGLWHTNIALMKVGGIRALSRLHALKAKGYDYRKRRGQSAGVWEYQLILPSAVNPEQLSLMEAR